MIPGVYTLTELQQAIAAVPNQWRLVLTNGCFDLLHVGHVRYLQAATNSGRSLVVGLNSEKSVQAIKSQPPRQPVRPMVPAIPEASIVQACGRQIELFPVEVPTSSTAIISRILLSSG